MYRFHSSLHRVEGAHYFLIIFLGDVFWGEETGEMVLVVAQLRDVPLYDLPFHLLLSAMKRCIPGSESSFFCVLFFGCRWQSWPFVNWIRLKYCLWFMYQNPVVYRAGSSIPQNSFPGAHMLSDIHWEHMSLQEQVTNMHRLTLPGLLFQTSSAYQLFVLCNWKYSYYYECGHHRPFLNFPHFFTRALGVPTLSPHILLSVNEGVLASSPGCLSSNWSVITLAPFQLFLLHAD